MATNTPVLDALAAEVAALRLTPPPAPPPVPPPASTVYVPLGANLVDVLRGAPEGAALQLPAGFTWQGDLVVDKAVSFVGPELPWSAGRVKPEMFDGGPLINGSFDVRVPGVAFRRFRQIGTRAEQNLLLMGDRCVVDQMAMIGSPAGCHRGIFVNAADCRVTRSYIANIWKDQDTQAVGGFDGTRNLVIDDCYLEASGENVMFGGVDPKTEAGIPQDILVQNCHLFKPLTWIGKPGCTVKNLFELKNAKRVRLANSLLENCWVSGQVGFGLVLTVRNQDGTAPFSTIEDVVIEGCTFKNALSGINILGRDDSSVRPSQTMKRVAIRNNAFLGLGANSTGGIGQTIICSGGPEDLLLEGNTFDGNVDTLMKFSAPTLTLTRFVVRGNRFQEGLYGIHASEYPLGKATLDGYAPGFVWEKNTVVRGTSGRVIPYPTGTTLV